MSLSVARPMVIAPAGGAGGPPPRRIRIMLVARFWPPAPAGWRVLDLGGLIAGHGRLRRHRCGARRPGRRRTRWPAGGPAAGRARRTRANRLLRAAGGYAQGPAARPRRQLHRRRLRRSADRTLEASDLERQPRPVRIADVDRLPVADVHRRHPPVSTNIPFRLPLSTATQRPLSKRNSTWARETRGCATRTSARRSRPITTSWPAANVRLDPSVRTVSAGGDGRLIGTNSMIARGQSGFAASSPALRSPRSECGRMGGIGTRPACTYCNAYRRIAPNARRRPRRSG